MPNANIFIALLDIQERHKEYFKSSNSTIVHHIVINWKDPISVQLSSANLPDDILRDMQEMLPMKTDQNTLLGQ